VQVFGDAHGNAVHMFERDCSLQRRRQKVIEEAPAPGMPDDVRKAMTDAAVKLAKAVGYEGAGTVEFIVDGAQPLALETFWFLEMNTRLQVEHPVTERVTGLDLVELQLTVAAGKKLPMKQKDIALNGHAIEARICAEDPAEGFLPGAGLIEEFGMLQPIDGETVRWDAGFESGDRVPASYDSLIAKLITHGETREAALTLLTDTLTHTQLVGVPGNAGFLLRCASSDAFEAGTHHVNWIAEQGEVLTAVPEEHKFSAALAVADILLNDDFSNDPWANREGWRSSGWPRKAAAVAIDGTVDVLEPDTWSLPDDMPLPLVTDLSPRRFAATAGGDSFLVTVPDYDADVEALLGGDSIKAPMPGKVIEVNVKPGDAVTSGDVMVVMEAMKMEHAMAAPRDGVVETVNVQAGDQVADSAVFVTLVPEE
jgi:acetyl/propionyl-CoA carboxylase alpha subunit